MTSQHSRPTTASRRAFLGGVALGAAVGLPLWPALARTAGAHARRGSLRVSLSVSPVTETLLGSLSLTDGRRTASTVMDVQQLVNRHTATEVYVRVATRQQARSGDAEYGWFRAIERAQLARELGMPLNPELGLWAVYGDIAASPHPTSATIRPSNCRDHGPPSPLRRRQLILWPPTPASWTADALSC
ncbi:MAG: hypothetical protein HYX51_07195 [Chloroflexi bacterium]|nr:hypothetical protein [Chloroflexota bacterium]